jgi:hypothetical protein
MFGLHVAHKKRYKIDVPVPLPIVAGCLCCTMREDLVNVLMKLVRGQCCVASLQLAWPLPLTAVLSVEAACAV